jgi:hypothetical protein
MKLKELWEPVIACGLVIGLALGAIAYFAKADDLKLVEMRLEQKIQADRVYTTQEQIWQLEDKYTKNGKLIPCSEWKAEDRKKYQTLQFEFEQGKKKLEGLK